MATQRPRKAETSSPPRRSARAKLLVTAEDRGFEPRRVLPANRISSAFPVVTGRSGNDRDRPELQVSRAGKAGIVTGPAGDARRVRTRNGHAHRADDGHRRSASMAAMVPGDAVERGPRDAGQPVDLALAQARIDRDPDDLVAPTIDRVLLGGPGGQHLPGLADGPPAPDQGRPGGGQADPRDRQTYPGAGPGKLRIPAAQRPTGASRGTRTARQRPSGGSPCPNTRATSPVPGQTANGRSPTYHH